MFSRFKRPVLAALLAAAAAAALPAVASAAISPTLSVSGDTAAGKSPATVTFNINFGNVGSDSPKDLSVTLPPGLLANANENGGACLIATSPTAACQVGSGTLTAAGIANQVTEYLVKAPKPADIGGVVLVAGSSPTGTVLSTADVTLTSAGNVAVAFTALPDEDVAELNVTLTTLRLPSNCASGTVTVTADSYADSASRTATATLTPMGCSSLAYSPKLTASITKDANDSGATIVATITQVAGESASKSIAFDLPSSLSPNIADLACLTAAGCTVGRVSAASPLIPAGGPLANGKVTLDGSISAPTITLSFPPPLAITLVGNVNLLSGNAVTFAPLPDLPLTSLVLTLDGGPAGAKAFDTSCAPGNLVGEFTPQDGAPADNVSAAIAYVNCAGAPTASSRRISGLVSLD